MLRLQADADPLRWVPITGSLGFRGRRHRKRAIGMLLSTAAAATGRAARPGGLTAWTMSQAAPFLLRKADGRVLVWVWKDDPELVVVLAQVQLATAQLRTARAMMPMEFDDTEDFRSRHLGVGEKLVRALPDGGGAPSATYTWDTGTAFVTLTAVGGDRERFGTVETALDALAESLRLVEDLPPERAATTLRLDPA